MHLHFSTPAPEQLASLSARLRNATQTTFITSFNIAIRSENLRLNLSNVLAHVLLTLERPERSRAAFDLALNTYNIKHGTQLTFESFTDIHWIRFVVGEVILSGAVATAVGHFIQERTDDLSHIPPEHHARFNFLVEYFRAAAEEGQPLTIEESALVQVLQNVSHGTITPWLLVEKGILHLESPPTYEWHSGGDYIWNLQNEIAACLWFLSAGTNSTLDQYAFYTNILLRGGLWPTHLESYLHSADLIKIGELACEYLQKETDPLRHADEFTKIRLDSDYDSGAKLNGPHRSVAFNYETPFDFYKSLLRHSSYFQGNLEFQHSRNAYRLLIGQIIDGDTAAQRRFKNTLSLLKDMSRPILIWMVANEIRYNYPQVIPYLLTDTELAPLAFLLIDDVVLDDTLLTDPYSRERKLEESFEIKDAFSEEMFVLFLAQLPNIHKEEAGLALAQILLTRASKTFGRISETSLDIITHQAMRKRYSRFLKLLSEKREDSKHLRSPSRFNFRYSVTIGPELVDQIIRILDRKSVYDSDYVRFNRSAFDLGIEVLRLTYSVLREPGVPESQADVIRDACFRMTQRLEKELTTFYTTQEIEVVDPVSGSVRNEQARWGMPEFGFEIIDWGYFYLHLEALGTAGALEDSFAGALEFNPNTSNYDSRNGNQAGKIVLYLRGQLLAFNSIRERKEKYELAGLPVADTLARLGKTILQYAGRHSADDPSQHKIDVFDDRFRNTYYNIYNQPLTLLLYKALDFFPEKQQVKFINDFFSGSTDLGRMLTAVNALHSRKVQDLISRHIAAVPMEKFISENVHLESSLIEAINSENHWKLAKPLLERIQEHFNRGRRAGPGVLNTLFEINLLLHYKAKDFDAMMQLALPTYTFGDIPEHRQAAESRRRYYTGLYKMNHDRNYDEAVEIFQELRTQDDKNVQYAYQLFRAQTLKALHE